MFTEIAYGGVSHRNQIIPLEQLPRYILKAQKEKVPLFHSVYKFDDSILDHFKTKTSVRSFKGRFWLNEIVFDIDKKSDKDDFVLIRVKNFLKTLEDDWSISSDDVKLFFSGRGYHIHVPDFFGFETTNKTPSIVKATIMKYFNEVDPSIYMATGLIRTPFTINEKSSLWKIPIDANMIGQLTAEDIKELAQTSKPRVEWSETDKTLIGKYQSCIIIPSTPELKEKESTISSDTTAIVTCMQKLYNKGASEGRRHTDMLRLISSYRRQGVPKEGIVAMMKNWAITMEEKEVRRMVEDTYKKSYQYSCYDTVMQEHCDPKCIFYKSFDFVPETASSKDMEKGFVDFVNNIDDGYKINLKNYFKTPEDFFIYPQEMVIFIGDTGVNKSALLQNIVVRSKLKTLYIDGEVGSNLFYRRFIQIKKGYSKEALYEHYKEEGSESLSSSIDFIKYMGEPCTVRQLKKIIAEENIQLLVIDTLEDIPNEDKFKDPVDTNAKELKLLAKAMGIIVLIVHHVSKHGVMSGKLDVHGGKGSSSVEQKADKVIAIEGNRRESLRMVTALKARDESPFTVALSFNKLNFRMEPISVSNKSLEPAK